MVAEGEGRQGDDPSVEEEEPAEPGTGEGGGGHARTVGPSARRVVRPVADRALPAAQLLVRRPATMAPFRHPGVAIVLHLPDMSHHLAFRNRFVIW